MGLLDVIPRRLKPWHFGFIAVFGVATSFYTFDPLLRQRAARRSGGGNIAQSSVRKGIFIATATSKSFLMWRSALQAAAAAAPPPPSLR